MQKLSHKQIINLVILVVTTAVVLSTLFLKPRIEVDSFEKCISQKDSMLMLTYPGQCITKDGRKFVEPVQRGEPKEISTEPEMKRGYEDCVVQGNPVMESYPEQCAYPDGETFTREISLDEMTEPGAPLDEMTYEDTFTCPANGWVNCMPTVSDDESSAPMERAMCTPEYEAWAQANCPGFEGFAY